MCFGATLLRTLVTVGAEDHNRSDDFFLDRICPGFVRGYALDPISGSVDVGDPPEKARFHIDLCVFR